MRPLLKQWWEHELLYMMLSLRWPILSNHLDYPIPRDNTEAETDQAIAELMGLAPTPVDRRSV